MAEVLDSRVVDGKEYFLYRGLLGQEALLRVSSDNKLLQLQSNGQETLWADFDAAQGSSYNTTVDDCTGRARVASRKESAEVQDRVWENGIRINYEPANCADAGLLADLFLPGLGLAERTYQSFTGPRKYRLTYARIAGISIAGAEYGFSMHLDRLTYTTPVGLNLRLTLKNTTKEPLTLAFPSSQSYDFSIRKPDGETVYTWSANKIFAAVYREERITGEKNWAVRESIELRPGSYMLEAWLVTEGHRAYGAQVPFTVAAPKAEP
jgi:hypothetical protein